MSASSSDLVGYAGYEPYLLTVACEAAVAKQAASRSERPSSTATARPPANASPAPVVSTTSAEQQAQQFEKELQQIAPETNPQGSNWHPGDAPSLALTWAVQALAKAGTLSIIGVYPPTHQFFPIGMAMNKNLTINMGNCNHRKYIPTLVDMVRSGQVDPEQILTQVEPLTSVSRPKTSAIALQHHLLQ